MKVLEYSQGGAGQARRLLARSACESVDVTDTVKSILAGVRERGDAALIEYTEKFDSVDLKKVGLFVRPEEIEAAAANVDDTLLSALEAAKKNIEKFHTKQLAQIKKQWSIEVSKGVKVGERAAAIESVGCYVPGGRAAYPSTVLMTTLVAKAAGVPRIVVASPPKIPEVMLAACSVCGVTEVVRAGGAQGVAALAYGTKCLPKVAKIVGPGNKYVTEAKRQVYGCVDVDMPAGPSEVLVLADETASPQVVASELLAQAEHDPDAQCVLVTASKSLVDEVSAEVAGVENAYAVITGSLEDSIQFTNDYAPEHLQVLVKDAGKVAAEIQNAGAVFIGPYSPVAAGDYASGGNHVLPTGGAAKYASPLSVRDFLKYTSVQEISMKGLESLREAIETLAEAEGLLAHKKSIEERFK